MELAPSKPLASRAAAHAASASQAPASQTLGRGLDVLEEVAAGPVALNVIAARLGLSRSTVHRLAASLLERRYLTLAPRRGYSLGPKLLELGSRARGQISLVRAARPFMEMLADSTGDAVMLAVRDGDCGVLADNVPGSRRVAPRLRVGERLDLLHSAAGRALLLAHDMPAWQALWNRLGNGAAAEFLCSMQRAAKAGIVLEPGTDGPNSEIGEIVSIAAPVRGADGAVRAALGLAMAAAYREAGMAPESQAALCRAAEAVSAELGWRNPPMHDRAAPAPAERELLSTTLVTTLGTTLGTIGGTDGPAGQSSRSLGTVPAEKVSLRGSRQTARVDHTNNSTPRNTTESDEQGMKGRGA